MSLIILCYCFFVLIFDIPNIIGTLHYILDIVRNLKCKFVLNLTFHLSH